MEDLTNLVLNLVQSYPKLGTLIAVVGFLRLIFKPLFSFLDVLAAATATPKDDEVLGKVKSSVFFKWFSYAVDYLGSIKIKK
jgi:hypothetical protein